MWFSRTWKRNAFGFFLIRLIHFPEQALLWDELYSNMLFGRSWGRQGQLVVDVPNVLVLIIISYVQYTHQYDAHIVVSNIINLPVWNTMYGIRTLPRKLWYLNYIFRFSFLVYIISTCFLVYATSTFIFVYSIGNWILVYAISTWFHCSFVCVKWAEFRYGTIPVTISSILETFVAFVLFIREILSPQQGPLSIS